jgi:hypothetical protein
MLVELRGKLTYANCIATVAVFLAIGGGAVAIGGTGGPDEIVACYDTKGHDKGDLRLLTKGSCGRKEKLIVWNQQGPQGEEGAVGGAGPPGPPGPNTGPAGGALAGSFPNPTLAEGAITSTAAFASGAMPAVSVAFTGSLSGGNGGATISYQGELFDTADMFDSAEPTVVTAPVDGLYEVEVNVLADFGGAAGENEGTVEIATSVLEAASGGPTVANGTGSYSASRTLGLEAGDEVTTLWITSGPATPAMDAYLGMRWVGPPPP